MGHHFSEGRHSETWQ